MLQSKRCSNPTIPSNSQGSLCILYNPFSSETAASAAVSLYPNLHCIIYYPRSRARSSCCIRCIASLDERVPGRSGPTQSLFRSYVKKERRTECANIHSKASERERERERESEREGQNVIVASSSSSASWAACVYLTQILSCSLKWRRRRSFKAGSLHGRKTTAI